MTYAQHFREAPHALEAKIAHSQSFGLARKEADPRGREVTQHDELSPLSRAMRRASWWGRPAPGGQRTPWERQVH